VVTTVLGASVNAYFYAAWMIASLSFYALTAVTTVLFALGSQPGREIRDTLRLTLGLSVVVSLGSIVFLVVGADLLLRLLGQLYAENADTALRLLSLGSIPLIVKTHYVAVCRINRRVARAAALIVSATVLELVGAAAGAEIGGLSGVGLGWVTVVCVEAVVMAPVVWRAAFPQSPAYPLVRAGQLALQLVRAREG
jgi:O-antigen/teichoic acid export membrane protein